VFTRVAEKYDLMNDFMSAGTLPSPPLHPPTHPPLISPHSFVSFHLTALPATLLGVHRLWKHEFIMMLDPQPGMRHLDVAVLSRA
jgi:hypothetical protein